STAYMQLNSLT
nr:immunoglobulin heavy chain junction region [Mus musculus]